MPSEIHPQALAAANEIYASNRGLLPDEVPELARIISRHYSGVVGKAAFVPLDATERRIISELVKRGLVAGTIEVVEQMVNKARRAEGVERFTPGDEVVGYGHFHIEAMSDGLIWLCLADQHFHISTKSGRGELTFTRTEPVVSPPGDARSVADAHEFGGSD